MSKTNEQIIAEVRAEEIKRNMPNWNNEKIQAHMKAVPLDEHELRIENAIIEKARASGVLLGRRSRSIDTGTDENAFIKAEEKGRQSSLAEIEKLKAELKDLKKNVALVVEQKNDYIIKLEKQLAEIV